MMPPRDLFPITPATVEQAYAFIFAPWVKELGLCDFEVEPGRVRARLPASEPLKFFAGVVSGQAIMAAIDTVTVLAMGTGDRATKGTVYQHTHFLRPTKTEDLLVESKVLRWGKSTAFAETRVTHAATGELAAHAVLEFAF